MTFSPYSNFTEGKTEIHGRVVIDGAQENIPLEGSQFIKGQGNFETLAPVTEAKDKPSADLSEPKELNTTIQRNCYYIKYEMINNMKDYFSYIFHFLLKKTRSWNFLEELGLNLVFGVRSYVVYVQKKVKLVFV